jgi:hypothetical protein
MQCIRDKQKACEIGREKADAEVEALSRASKLSPVSFFRKRPAANVRQGGVPVPTGWSSEITLEYDGEGCGDRWMAVCTNCNESYKNGNVRSQAHL